MKLDSIWQVEGTLTTVAPLHVGDGGTCHAPFRRAEGQPEEQAEVQTAAKTLDGRARIPGSSLKGVVRGGFETADADIFGIQEKGGLVQFLDAYTDEALPWKQLVLGRTAIDEVTGAAQDHLLFQMQVVPEKTEFRVRIRGKAFAGQRWQDAAALIDLGMRRFNDGTIRLGAGESNQWGRCKWKLDAVRVMDAAARGNWLENPAPLDVALGKLDDRKGEVISQTPVAAARGKTLHLKLRFDGHPFLVNDPRKTGTQKQRKHAHAARRTPDGKLLLPAESFRGVFAHQAARIARTRNKDGGRQQVKRTASHHLPQDTGSLTRVFGGPGWGSVIEVRDFVETGRPGKPCPADPKVQEFLAVDRFTGGGAEERKFDAEGGWEPWLEGAITVDLRRLQMIGKPEPALGLLALTLRDLAEGDLAVGWGSGKGYGWATVDTGGLDATKWVESQLAGWCEGGAKDWIRAWEAEGGNHV